MKTIVAMLAVVALPVLAADPPGQGNHSHHERIINQASELVPWCKSEAESRYIAKNITPYQWSASYHDRSNVLFVEGRLRVHGDDIAVRCRIARGAREGYAVIEINDPAL
ncbi:hypothetical protein [Aerolutibacter ruishenii]|uniref:hypothetical protein n=1 Tax=Aerolutibacter ruishenii TaxID=686800 RepID=UPI00119D0965|nr:hypothetical protein [Lysobacter ruishenii]